MLDVELKLFLETTLFKELDSEKICLLTSYIEGMDELAIEKSIDALIKDRTHNTNLCCLLLGALSQRMTSIQVLKRSFY